MNCKKIKKLLDTYVRNEINDNDKTIVHSHISTCKTCHEDFIIISSLLKTVSSFSRHKENLPAGFEANLHAKLLKQSFSQSKKATPFLNRYSLIVAIAASLLIILGIFYGLHLPGEFESKGKILAQSEVPSGQPITIELEYIADKPHKEIQIEINLDDGIHFFSKHQEISSLMNHTWKGDFSKGKNLIPFVVTLSQKGKFTIHTTTVFEGKRHRHRIVLSAADIVTVTYYQLPEEKLHEDTSS